MLFQKIGAWRRKRAHRKENRRIVREFYADGGDSRLRFDYVLTPDSVALDLGGFEGQWASDLYSRNRCKIHVFEPVAKFAEGIRQRFRNNADIEVHELALGGSNRTEQIHIRGASSSLYKQRAESEEIRFVDVAAWLQQARLGAIALMKINIEGGEYELLERMIETEQLDAIENFQIQFHNFTPDAARRMADIQHALRKTHEATYQYRFVWENWRRV
jgi:FkbM family methyltransferase